MSAGKSVIINGLLSPSLLNSCWNSSFVGKVTVEGMFLTEDAVMDSSHGRSGALISSNALALSSVQSFLTSSNAVIQR